MRHPRRAVRAASLVAAASAAAVLGVAVAGWNSTPSVTTQSGVVRPAEIVVGWSADDTIDGRPLPIVTTPSRPTP
jgi:hypothetical protein